jgi:hypothetical protein
MLYIYAPTTRKQSSSLPLLLTLLIQPQLNEIKQIKNLS